MSPATSEAQRRIMCLALSIKQGKTPRSRSDEASKLADSMSEQQLKDFCGSKVQSKERKYPFIGK